MNTPSASARNASARSRLRNLFNRQTVFAFLAGASVVGGVGAAAAAVNANGWHHGMMMMHGSESPADVTAHVDHVLKHLYVEIDATDAQKAKIGPSCSRPPAISFPCTRDFKPHTAFLSPHVGTVGCGDRRGGLPDRPATHPTPGAIATRC